MLYVHGISLESLSQHSERPDRSLDNRPTIEYKTFSFEFKENLLENFDYYNIDLPTHFVSPVNSLDLDLNETSFDSAFKLNTDLEKINRK